MMVTKMIVLLMVTAVVACSSDGDKKPEVLITPATVEPLAVPDAGVVDAGVVDAGGVDAGAVDVDAGVVDAGPSLTTADAPPQPKGAGLGDAARAQANRLAMQHKTTDRILVKPRDDMRNPEEIVAFIKKELKLEVVSVRRTAGTWYLLTFAATDPPRDLDAQRALIAKLISTKAFLKVEGDRVMTLK
jgi:hypothetical protein